MVSTLDPFVYFCIGFLEKFLSSRVIAVVFHSFGKIIRGFNFRVFGRILVREIFFRDKSVSFGGMAVYRTEKECCYG